MLSWQPRLAHKLIGGEEQEQKLLMRRREVITERRCQLRRVGGDLFVASHGVMANLAKLAGNVTSSIALLTWRSWEMGLIFNHLQSAMGLTPNFIQFQYRGSLAGLAMLQTTRLC